MTSPSRTSKIQAVVFDLDGVITRTAAVHSAAWKQLFDDYLRRRAARDQQTFREFTHDGDYLPHVDGKPRYDGVRDFLASRDITLPEGAPSDASTAETICGLGNRKNELFNELLADGVEVFESTIRLVERLRAAGVRVGVASSSKNCRAVLEAAGIDGLFETRIDGLVSAELGLSGKPAPDIFVTACARLDSSPDRAVVVEDAVSGVVAGRRGNFGLVVGVAREGNRADLLRAGADLVVADLAELVLDDLEAWFGSGLLRDGWTLRFHGYDAASEGPREALCAVGNGYFATRGAAEETAAGAVNYPGTYLAGVYDRLASQVAGRTVHNEDLVNCPSWLPLTFRVDDGPWFDPNRAEIVEYLRELDLRSGVLWRSLVVRDEQGRETAVESWRLARQDHPHRAAQRYAVTPRNHAGTITVRAALDGGVSNTGVARYRALSSQHLEVLEAGADAQGSLWLRARTNGPAPVELATAARMVAWRDGAAEIAPSSWQPRLDDPARPALELSLAVARGETLRVDKLVALCSSIDPDRGTTPGDPLDRARAELTDGDGFDQAREAASAPWEQLWDLADIVVEGDRLAQKLLRLHIYHLFVTASPASADLDAGIPARGLHGEAYRGHIFWDELFILPFYSLHTPAVARRALRYRHRRLDAARRLARVDGATGALFPWQSGSSGDEETQTLHLNPLSGEWGPDHSHRQHHVSLAIALNIWRHVQICDDRDLLATGGAELLCEICRYWAAKARPLDSDQGPLSIDGVMGPDEFHEKYPDRQDGGLRDNAYTNLMVAWVLDAAPRLLELLDDDARNALREAIALDDAELARWQDVATRLRVPISDDGVLEQYDGYFALQEVDWAGYRERHHSVERMDRILKAEGRSPDAFKVSKQADALMAFYNLGPARVARLLETLGHAPGCEPHELLRRNFDYYYGRTSHGSTLSRLVHADLATAIREAELGWQLFDEALRSDFEDVQGGTTAEGIHAGVMAGTVLLALGRYAGVDLVSGGSALRVDPALPAHWRSLRCCVGWRGDRYRLEVTREAIEITILPPSATQGPDQRPRSVVVAGIERTLLPGRPARFALTAQPTAT